MPRIAYCTNPYTTGMFRFYRNLRAALAPHGWEVIGPWIGAAAAERWDPVFADDGCVLIAAEGTDAKEHARAFAKWVEQHDIDIVVPMDDEIAASTLRHLPKNVRVVTRCASITTFSYRICLICPERVSRVVATSPRQLVGLRGYRTFPSERIRIIPHGVDLTKFSRRTSLASGVERSDGYVRLAYLGNLDDHMKGILWLPDILARLTQLGVNCTLDVVGDGVDRAKLVRKLRRRGVGKQCHLHGELKTGDIVSVLSEADIFVFPTRLEGFPNALLEAMALGLAPVATHVRGVTDYIVDQGKNGILCHVGDTAGFAEAIRRLAANRKLLLHMACMARRTVEERFSLERMGHDYDRLFREVLNEPAPDVRVWPWSEFRTERAYRVGLRRWVPTVVKNLVRRYLA